MNSKQGLRGICFIVTNSSSVSSMCAIFWILKLEPLGLASQALYIHTH